MKFCLEVIQKSIKEVNENVVQRCWVKSNALPAFLNSRVNANVDRSKKIDKETDNELSSLLSGLDLSRLDLEGLSPKEMIEQDSLKPIDESEMNDEEIIEELLHEYSPASVKARTTKTSSNENVPSSAEVQAALSTLTKFAAAKRNAQPLLINDVENLRQKIPVKSKQASMTCFFDKK